MITVAIPTIPPRYGLLARAIRSIGVQTRPANAISVSVDTERQGAAVVRQRALDAVQTPWTAFLDDDDEFLPFHLEQLLFHAEATGSDYVYSWFHVAGGGDPFPPYHFTNEFDPANPIQTTITVLVRTELAKEVGFTQLDEERLAPDGQRWGEDYSFTLGCLKAGGKISHLVNRTWIWHHDSQNTSGRPDRW